MLSSAFGKKVSQANELHFKAGKFSDIRRLYDWADDVIIPSFIKGAEGEKRFRMKSIRIDLAFDYIESLLWQLEDEINFSSGFIPPIENLPDLRNGPQPVKHQMFP
jgi:hypothetical protein